MTEEEARRFYHGSKWTQEELNILQVRQPIVYFSMLLEEEKAYRKEQRIEEIVLNHD